MGMEEHLPVTLITELELNTESLDKYKVLFLPNTVCLSDLQIETIQRYVQEGGGLVATCETSLCDELGHSRGDFGLKNLFGTSYGGRPLVPQVRTELDANFAIVIDDSYWAQRANAGAFRFSDFPNSIFAVDPRQKRLVPNGQATFKGPLVKPTGFQGGMEPAVMYFPEGSREPFPAVALGEYGKGRVVYFAAGIDAAHFSYAFPYQRVMLSRAVQWAAKKSYPVEVIAPMCVQSTFWRQQGNRLIVHLWNGINSTSDHGLQDVETPLREESIAIHGIQLKVDGIEMKSAKWEPERTDIPFRKQGDLLIYEIPPLLVHGAVVFEQ